MKVFLEEIDFGTPEYDEVIALRTEVLRTPLGLSFSADELANEYDQRHFALYQADRVLVGCVVLKLVKDHVVKMRQVAIRPHLQGKGLGHQLISQLEDWCRHHHITDIELAARDTAVDFYLSQGYTKLVGLFEEVGIPHYKMVKHLEAVA